jgi:hypothetical protein
MGPTMRDRLYLHRLLLPMLAIVAAMAACDSPEEEGPDASCFYECGQEQICRDGVVTDIHTQYVPCEIANGECIVSDTYTCERGCRTDIPDIRHDPNEPIEHMCEEFRPKQVGEPCQTEEDCRPEVATVTEEGIVNVYLTCDTAAGACIAREAPVVPDWLAPCGLTPQGSPDFGYRFVETDACSGGVCIARENESCVEQGCSIYCASDGECPAGSYCESDAGVCYTGYPGHTDLDLTCEPG